MPATIFSDRNVLISLTKFLYNVLVIAISFICFYFVLNHIQSK